MKNTLFLGIIFSTIIGLSCSFTGPKAANTAIAPKIKWYTIQEAEALNKKEPRKMVIDVYTDWCGWCKKMDASTFQDTNVAKTINKYYYAVKFNAEDKAAINFNGKDFTFKPENRSHELAIALLNGQMSYPSIAYLDETLNMITVVPGFRNAPEMDKILRFLGTDAYKSSKFEDFK